MDKVDEENNIEEVKSSKKRIITPKRIVIFALAGILSVKGYSLYKNRKPDVKLSNKQVIDMMADDVLLDDVINVYNIHLSNKNISMTDSTKINNFLSGENDIVLAMDKVQQCLDLSDKLESYKLDEVISFNGDLRSLTNEEQKNIENLNYFDLLELVNKYEEIKDVNHQDFKQESIDKCSLAMKLSYALKIINSQLIKYGSYYLAEFPQLIIQSTIIDKANLSIQKYRDIQIKDIDTDNDYEAYYYEPEIGAYYDVELDDNVLKEIAEYKGYFYDYYNDSSNESFKEFKNNARRAINTYKISMLKTYSLEMNKNFGHVKYELEANQSNSEIREKLKSIK